MNTLRFNDGASFNTSGPYRIETRRDGLYVVGQGMLMAVDTHEEGEEIIAELMDDEAPQ